MALIRGPIGAVNKGPLRHVDLLLTLDRVAGRLAGQVAGGLRDAVRAGRLPPISGATTASTTGTEPTMVPIVAGLV